MSRSTSDNSSCSTPCTGTGVVDVLVGVIVVDVGGVVVVDVVVGVVVDIFVDVVGVDVVVGVVDIVVDVVVVALAKQIQGNHNTH